MKYYINKEHPIIERILTSKNIKKDDVKTILKLISETTPVEAIIQNYSENPESIELRNEGKELEQGTILLAQMMYDSLSKSGVNREMALKQILNIEPFNEYPQLIEHVN